MVCVQGAKSVMALGETVYRGLSLMVGMGWWGLVSSVATVNCLRLSRVVAEMSVPLVVPGFVWESPPIEV